MDNKRNIKPKNTSEPIKKVPSNNKITEIKTNNNFFISSPGHIITLF